MLLFFFEIFKRLFCINILKYISLIRQRLPNFKRHNVSLEFVKSGKYRSEINEAAKQETHLMYLTCSELQETELSTDYLKAWAERKYQTNDHFLNYIKSVFRESNFLLFRKFMRFPLPSARIIQNKIKPQLKRVFNAEDSDFKYTVTGADENKFMPILDVNSFNEQLFDAYFSNHNSIAIAELDADTPNTPFRYLINIEKVRSIEPTRNGRIKRIAFSAELEVNGKTEKGTIYIDKDSYIFYFADEKQQPIEAKHDLGYCPAHFISDKKYKDKWVVRESLLTYVREELEEYNFLKTLQKMTEPNGVSPVVTKLDTGSNVKKSDINDPDFADKMGGQQPELFGTNPPQGTGLLAAGTVHLIPPEPKDNGGFDMEIVKNFITFHYLPTENLKYLNDRINEIEKSIIGSIVGDIIESNEESKNTMQIEKSMTVLDNTLFSFAELLNRIRILSDKDMLSLMFGTKRVKDVFISFGTDFMIDSQSLLFDQLSKAPNVIERKHILKRINNNRYKNNQLQAARNNLLYDLLPFISDSDFEKAVSSGLVSPEKMKLQIQFSYWISKFEARYGDIVAFYELEESKEKSILLINNLIVELIKEEEYESSTPTNQSGSISE